MQVERVDRISRQDFNEHFVKPRRPVILTGLIDAWPAAQKWSLDWFREHHGARMVERRGATGSVTLAQHIEQTIASTPERPAPYLRNINIQTDWPELVSDVLPRIGITAPDWLSSPLMPQGWPRKAKYLNQLFISGAGTTIPLHYDEWMMHAFITNVVGRKEFSLFPPEDGDKLYPSAEYDLVSEVPDPYRVDPVRYPLFQQARRTSVVLEAGESVFLPCGWWHTTQTLEPCISVSSNFVNQHNWTSFRREMVRVRRQSGQAAWKNKALNAYLTGLGGLMQVERVLAPGILNPDV